MSIIDGFFYINGAIALFSAVMAMTKKNAVHALLYFIVSVLSLAMAFFLLNAPLAAALEVMIYAGAIMVLFVFVVMLLNIYKPVEKVDFVKSISTPLLLSILLMLLFFMTLTTEHKTASSQTILSVKSIAIKLFTDYSIFIELSSLILLAGLVGSFHLGKKITDKQ